MKAGIFTYGWDLDAEGHDHALGRIAEAGFSGVNLATSYHAGKFLLPHNPRHRVFFPEDGALYFRPDSAKYGRIQPRVSSLVTSDTDPLRDLDREREKHGLELIAWTVVLHNSWLGAQYPDCTMHTAFGDPLIHSLSPAHPDVQEYICAMVADMVSSARITAIQLESPDYMSFQHGYHHEVIPVPLGADQQLLLGTSFNPVEIERAGTLGIDAEALQHQVADALDTSWNDPDNAAKRMNDVFSNPDFQKYQLMLIDCEAEFIDKVKASIQRASPETEVRLFAGMAASETDAGVPDHIIQLADGLLSGYVPSDDAARNRSTQLKELMGERPVYGMVRAISPDADMPAQAVSRVNAWKESGVDGIDVYNYGFMTLPMIEAVGQALKT
jgi:hypothetical protein